MTITEKIDAGIDHVGVWLVLSIPATGRAIRMATICHFCSNVQQIMYFAECTVSIMITQKIECGNLSAAVLSVTAQRVAHCLAT